MVWDWHYRYAYWLDHELGARCLYVLPQTILCSSKQNSAHEKNIFILKYFLYIAWRNNSSEQLIVKLKQKSHFALLASWENKTLSDTLVSATEAYGDILEFHRRDYTSASVAIFL
tara:strand:+ start:28864 stop:29208 length:345 start_codon:yes stop_codon:yes gene_type:complete